MNSKELRRGEKVEINTGCLTKGDFLLKKDKPYPGFDLKVTLTLFDSSWAD